MKRSELKRKTPMKSGSGPRRRPKTHTPKWWRGQCDILWSKLIRLPGQCMICGVRKNLQAHHLIPRQAVFYRHWPENGVCLCPGCHTTHYGQGDEETGDKISAHGTPKAFEDWLAEHRPRQHEWWCKHRHHVVTGQKLDYEDIYHDLEAAWRDGRANLWVQRQLGMGPTQKDDEATR